MQIFRTGVSCFSVTLFYSTLLALTDGQKDRQRVKYTPFTWAGGTLFPVVLLCQFFVLAGNRFWFFGSGGKLFLVLLTYLVYNTVVRLCQFFCCDRKTNLVRIFLLNPNFLLVHRNNVSVTVYLFLALYGSTTIQSRLLLKNIENFV